MMKRFNKYIVVKRVDVPKYLSFAEEDLFLKLLAIIEYGRAQDGRTQSRYVVVNEDKPYAEKVWQFIEEAEDAKEDE